MSRAVPIEVRPVRLQLSRRKGFNLQEHSRSVNGLDAVNVARPSKWGNPYKAGMSSPDVRGRNRVMVTNDCLVKAFRGYALRSLEVRPARFDELRGKNLACWCKGSPCHADVLLEIANPAVPISKIAETDDPR